MPERSVATVGSMHVCPMCSGTVPHVGGTIIQGESNVLVNGNPVATMGSICTCIGAIGTVIQGSPTVFVNGKPIACVGDMTQHGGIITSGSPNVFIGSSPETPTKTNNLQEIAFPEISLVNRIQAVVTGNNDALKEAAQNMEKIKNEADKNGFLNAIDFSF